MAGSIEERREREIKANCSVSSMSNGMNVDSLN